MESLRGHADHREWMAVEHHRPAKEGGIGVEMSSPEPVTQHHHWTRPRVVAIGPSEQASGGWYCAEHGEVVKRDNTAEYAFRPDIGAHASETHRLRKPRIRVYPVEARGPLADIEIIRIRARAEATTKPAGADVNETVRFDHARRRLEEQRVRHREDRGVGADAKGERERGSRGKEAITSKQPPGVSEIPPRIVEPAERAGVAMQILRLRHAAERPFRGEPRFFTG